MNYATGQNFYTTGGWNPLSLLTMNLNKPQPTLPPPQAAPVMPYTNQNVQQQMGRLTGQASDVLYGGILGYQPKPMTAMGGQQFAPPQGNLVDPFQNMQGLLGRSQFQTPRMY
jgi:hypothetical protein